MNNLTERQIEYIAQAINRSKIESADLKEDLMDHFCCAIEEEMKKGLNFEDSYQKAFLNICPDGLDEIQKETIFLLTSKKIKAMKKLLYVSGYLSAIGLTTTFVMKSTHIGGAMITLLLTTAILVFIFLPTLFITLYKRAFTKNLSDKLKYIFGFIGAALFITSIAFKIAHWPGATLILVTSIATINFVFFPLLFFKMYKTPIE